MKILAALLLTLAPAPVYRERPVPDVVPGVYSLFEGGNVSLVALFADGTSLDGSSPGRWSYRKGVLTLRDRVYRVRSHKGGVWVGDGFRLRREW